MDLHLAGKVPWSVGQAGTVVTISSVNAFLPDPTVVDYAASKAALSNSSKALSKEVGSKGIRVNSGESGTGVHGTVAG